MPAVLVWVISLPPHQAKAQDRGDRYMPTSSRCIPPRADTPSSPNGDGRSGFAPARAAATEGSNGPPDNGFPVPARPDAHGQQLAGLPEPARPRTEQRQCAQSCDTGYTLATGDDQQWWCQRSKPQAIRMSAPQELKPAGIDAPFQLKRDGKNKHTLNPAKLAPWQGSLLIEIVGADGKPLAGQPVKLAQTVEDDSGGHPERKHKGQRPLAVLFEDKKALPADKQGEITAPLVTDAQGRIKLFFSASEFTGLHRLKAECAKDACGVAEVMVTVKVPDLAPYEPAPGTAQLVGGSNEKHEQRHYLTKTAARNLDTIIEEMNEAGWKPVGVNDAALPWGGLFDIAGSWKPSHFDHGAGTAVDIRTNGITLETKAATYKDQCSESKDPGALSNKLPVTKILWHDGPPRDMEYFHVYLVGTAPNGAVKKSCQDAGNWMNKAEEKAKTTAEKKG
ncbi:hypothetical protein J8I26_01350 [Herbaspirillum sp. LeCh32-8]|uniref:hypothetical protein n=1 Tax=Herbaspirillum sp. LeCh32-8 TaxID=2821356 RepID=UPI001AE3D00E|nr:hypothetical protein [Herbaspirillum sp. LeCh32-8]MBP0596735.1 hypothetical protein [Herbaspirillum sp. LeCh32-8]